MNTLSVLGKSFVDAQFLLLGVGFTILPPTLVLNVPVAGTIPMLMADGTFITADDAQDYIDANPLTLPSSFVIAQSPPPGVFYDPSVINYAAATSLGYVVPTAIGPRPVP